MKKKMFVSMLVILVAVAATVGGTMAWFTDEAEITPNVFTAGTLLIDATDSWADDASLIVQKWNPGDCSDKEVELEVVGTKRAFVRMKVTESWTMKYVIENGYVKIENGLPVEITPAPAAVVYTNLDPQAPDVSWVGYDSTKWQLIGDWLYYKGMLDPELSDGPKKITIMTRVCFSKEAGNEYQGAVYTIDAKFEAIQVTNEAVNEVWGFYWDEAVEEWLPVPVTP